ncbi:chain length determinant protein EpsF [Caldimonas tepidiphila]|uniref:chain length determinant protein EpsF n=1 Tax=Caldimonas tepidiphila TaxID=2315841 RepID=UPI000E5A92FB|nr:chain length determinant protein EpsF [Caldimonas tepidiphila]
MSIGHFLSVILARWKAALLVFLLVVGAAAAYLAMQPRTYTARAALVLESKADPVSNIVYQTATPAYIATQMEIVRSDRVALRVVRDLRLAENPDTRQQWVEATGAQGNFEHWLARALLGNVEVSPARQSNVLQVSYQSVDPRFSALMANAFAKAYIDTTLDLRTDPARQYSSFFDAHARQLRDAVQAAQNKLSAFQRESGITATAEHLDIENARLAELSSQLVAVQALAAESGSRQAAARRSAEQMQDVQMSPLVAGLRGDMLRQEAQLQQLNERYGPNHPQVQEAKATIAALRERIAAETRRVTGGVAVNDNINRMREAEIRASLEAQRAKVLKLKGERDQIAVLQRDVENAQRAYDAVLTRLSQTSLESNNTMTNVSILDPATEPSSPSGPRVPLVTALAVLIGGFLALVTAFLLELFDRRVRSADDVLLTVGLPVLGEMPRPMQRRLFRRRGELMPRRVLGQLPSAQNGGL